MKLLGYLFAFLVSVSMVVPCRVIAAGPTEELKPTLNGIMTILRDPALSGEVRKEERRRQIMDVATRGFDFSMMSQLALGQTWQNISQDQRTHFENLFTKLLENAYVGKLEDYTGQVTKYIGEQIQENKAEVTTMMENNGVTLPVNYIMVNNGSGWKVYDIKIEGVRLLRNYRAQFKSILRTENFEGLVRILEEKNAAFSSNEI